MSVVECSEVSADSVTPAFVHAALVGNGEIAIVDVREIQPFDEGHLLWAVSLPLSRLELRIDALVPRRSTPIVCCDGGEGLAARAVARLQDLGYTDVTELAGGISAWDAAGYEVFAGVNVPSKAFGEFIEHQTDTPSVSADELAAMFERGEDLVVLDSRPVPEFRHFSIPGGVCCPGAELVYRVGEMAPGPETTVVVNCAGRTRSIIGAQSLIDAGIPNRVVALRNGIMGWKLAGHEPLTGETQHAPDPSPQSLRQAQDATAQIAERTGVTSIDMETLDQWTSESAEHTLYLLDVRTIDEFGAGHMPGSVHAAGGQLVQSTDSWIATRNARIVLIDADGVRSTMTAGWLRQMGHPNVVIFDLDTVPELEQGPPLSRILGLDAAAEAASFVSADELADLIASDSCAVIDLSPSPTYRKRHISGSWFSTRARIEHALQQIPVAETVVLTSSDGVVATLAADDDWAQKRNDVRVLRSGNTGWVDAGMSMVADPVRLADEADDYWKTPLDPNRRDGKTIEQAMNDYLSWEVALDEQIERDATTRFSRSPQATG